MATFALRAAQKFPEGTTVGAFPLTNWTSGVDVEAPSGAPPGAAAASATITNGVANFSGLNAQPYWVTNTSGTPGSMGYTKILPGADAQPGSSGFPDPAFAEIPTFANITSTSYVNLTPDLVVPNLTIVSGAIVEVSLFADFILCNAATGGGFLVVIDGVNRGTIGTTLGAQRIGLASKRVYSDIAPGTHTFRIQAKTTDGAQALSATVGDGTGVNNRPMTLIVKQF